jgi:hypothetical protein
MLGFAESFPTPELVLWLQQDPPVIPPHSSLQNKDMEGWHKTYSKLFCSPRDCKLLIRKKFRKNAG